jgi:SnoaL-like domain
VDAGQAARAWIEGWQRAWPAKDVEGIASMYRDDAPYLAHPFRDQTTARAYVTDAFADEELVECRFGDPIVAGDRAAVEYWAILAGAGREATLLGISVLRFGDDGKVESHRDYWAMEDGRRPPPPGWGR